MRMARRVQAEAHRAPDAPRADADQHHADDLFAMTRDRVERQLLAEHEQQQRDQQHPGSVANAPLQAGLPLPAVAVRGERRDGGQVIGHRENMEQTGGKTRDKRKHDVNRPKVIAESTSAGRTLRARAGRSPARCPTSYSRQTRQYVEPSAVDRLPGAQLARHRESLRVLPTPPARPCGESLCAHGISLVSRITASTGPKISRAIVMRLSTFAKIVGSTQSPSTAARLPPPTSVAPLRPSCAERSRAARRRRAGRASCSCRTDRRL